MGPRPGPQVDIVQRREETAMTVKKNLAIVVTLAARAARAAARSEISLRIRDTRARPARTSESWSYSTPTSDAAGFGIYRGQPCIVSGAGHSGVDSGAVVGRETEASSRAGFPVRAGRLDPATGACPRSYPHKAELCYFASPLIGGRAAPPRYLTIKKRRANSAQG